MYERICRLLLNNGVRLIYTTNRVIGNTLKKLEKKYPSFHSEVSTNEKIAYELALTGSIATKRTACVLSTEGIYEALDPVMSSAYMGVLGGFLIVCIRETEEEVTPLGPFSKLPVMVSENEDEFAQACFFGYSISEKYEIPVIIQTAIDEGHSPLTTQHLSLTTQHLPLTTHHSQFTKNPSRWAATPKFRFQLHKELNSKIEKIREEFEGYAGNVKIKKGKTGIITDRHSGLEFYDEDTSMLHISTVFPLPNKLVNAFIEEMDKVYVVDGPHHPIELQIQDRRKVIIEQMGKAHKRQKPEEKMYGFNVLRDILGPASSINMAHGIKKLEPDKKVLAITYEDHFFHSGMPAFVNTLYNNSSYVLLIMTNTREEEIKKIMKGCGFSNFFHINAVSEVEKFKDRKDLTVLFCRGII
jgi:TPP-dependent indolepyruvate ferredoxin oxidoreductase alpha subunit